MTAYAIRRLILLFPTLVGLSLVVFLIIRVLPPQDAIDQIVAEYSADDPGLKQQLQGQLGLSGSIPQQYLSWAANTLRGDFGKSLHTRRPIVNDLKKRIPVSFELSLIGLFFAWVVSFPLGVLSAVFQDRGPDYLLRGSAYLLESIPSFAIGILVITYLAVYFNWAPPTTFTYLWDNPINHLKIMILPIAIIGIAASGSLIRFTRTVLLEVLRQDYIRTARAKGLIEATVIRRHALRNVALPFITVIGLTIPGLLTSSVFIEQIFNLPGMGRYLVEAVGRLDYPVIQATTMLFALVTVVSHLVVDLSYAWVDPRISYRR